MIKASCAVPFARSVSVYALLMAALCSHAAGVKMVPIPIDDDLIIFVPVTDSSVAGPAAPVATEAYQYDALGRLTSVTYTNGKQQGFAYDAAGNRKMSGPTSPTAGIGTPTCGTSCTR